ncbi:hypothetical protein KC340_g8675 [Hortaea werneckii]|nr:hypothetical protein KC342_g9181 [Hortaea werneckii]KAI7095728.1 hypothetical protein KC339_g10859 [Hortaea werneckii]KAI7214192.1 hypothetical protein KC365_g14015 [Hortaea werneckii]KAI7316359.1 hypothetical protein KC340_g8675 [Hortaea werneckii]KAI7395162.1 hypothetical protein KC328_g5825 [Hortaea werneckii]
MSSEATPNPRSGTTTANEAQPNYDQDVDDFLRDLPVGGDTNNNNNNNNNSNAEPAKDVDEEVKVRKKRAPVPKLDETLLLSNAGIPKLRQTGKKFRFKGKGHEFSDIERLLNMYQLWMDDMYPRAKFRDAVTMVEKVGHSKRMQINRRGWMDATKPHRREDSPERLADVAMGGDADGGLRRARGERSPDGRGDDIFGERESDEQQTSRQSEQRNGIGAPEDDDLDALMAENGDGNQSNVSQQQQQRRSKPTGPFEEDDDDGPDEDELDALLAGETPTAPVPAPQRLEQRRGPFEEENGPDEDELDALMAEEGSKSDRNMQPHGPPPAEMRRSNDDEFADEEEAMASMGGMW